MPLVDTNIILDLVTDDPTWAEWSQTILSEHAADELIINPAIYAELCFGYQSAKEVDALLVEMGLTLEETPREGLFAAARAFAEYKRKGGARRFVLPDFFIGGHALVTGTVLITRDRGRYATYFPKVTLIAP